MRKLEETKNKLLRDPLLQKLSKNDINNFFFQILKKFKNFQHWGTHCIPKRPITLASIIRLKIYRITHKIHSQFFNPID